MTKKSIAADGLLLLTAIIWGSAFVVVKNALDSFAPALLVGIRFLLAFFLALFAFRRHLHRITARDVFHGAVTGSLLGLAYIVQTIGLTYTTAGKNAFLTATYVLLVPFGERIVFGERLKIRHYFCAGLMLTGIGLLSLSKESGGINFGDFLSFICGIFFAAHMMVIPRFQKQTNMYLLIILQFLFCSALAFLWHAFFEPHTAFVLTGKGVWELVYLVVFSTTLGMSLQNIGESMTRASHAAMILSLESVFGVVFSAIFLREKITPWMLAGFTLILAAIMISVRKKGAEDRPESPALM